MRGHETLVVTTDVRHKLGIQAFQKQLDEEGARGGSWDIKAILPMVDHDVIVYSRVIQS